MTSTTSDMHVERDGERRQPAAAAHAGDLVLAHAHEGGRRGAGAADRRLDRSRRSGLVVILLGWWGASHTPNLYEQVPYSISGGMFGLGLVFAGGFAYFAYWMTQLVRATQRDTAETRAVLERIESLLSGGTVGGGNGSSSMAPSSSPRPPTSPPAAAPSTTAPTARPSPAARASRQSTRQEVQAPPLPHLQPGLSSRPQPSG